MEMKRDIKEILILHGINKKNKELLNKIILFLDKTLLNDSNKNEFEINMKDNFLNIQFIDELFKIHISFEKITNTTRIKKRYALISYFCYDTTRDKITLKIPELEFLKNIIKKKCIKNLSSFIKYLSLKPIYQSFFDYVISKKDEEIELSSKELYQLLGKELTYNSSNFNKILKNLEKDFKEIYPNFYIEIEKIYKGINEKKDICGYRKENVSFKIKVQNK